MDIEKAKPSKGGDAKPWVQLINIRIARLPKVKSLFFAFLFLTTLPFLGLNDQAFSGILSWTLDSGQATGYRIYFGESCNNLQTFIDVGDVSQYTLNNMPLSENKSYCFAVKAYNQSIESPFSNTVNWTTADNTPPSPPTEVKAQ
jgi:hypothetical protein